MDTNTWTINEEIVKDFENYAPNFVEVQPPFAKKSKVSLTEISPWTNRVPMHEPWPRVLKIDEEDEQNTKNDGYKNNVDWIDQYNDDGSEEGSKPIGVVEGDQENDRGRFWRR
mgnify:FL=1